MTNKILAAALTAATLTIGACSAMNLGIGGAGAPSATETDPEENKKLARKLKSHVRLGKYNWNTGGKEFERLVGLCGKKVWDRCQVRLLDGKNSLGYERWQLTVNETKKVYDIPELFYDIAELNWSSHIVSQMGGIGPDREGLFAIMHEKCGDPIYTKCVIRRSKNPGEDYLIRVKDGDKLTDEIITLETIRTWAEDL